MFVEDFNSSDLNNLNKNISIIFRNYKKKLDESTLLSLKNYCRINKRKFYLTIDIKMAIKHQLNGVYIPSFVKTNNFNFPSKPKNFSIIGSAHNKAEIKTKENQGCNLIFLAPTFKVDKKVNYLGVNRFNLLTLNNKNSFIALGGINKNNMNNNNNCNNNNIPINLSKEKKLIKNKSNNCLNHFNLIMLIRITFL